MQEISIGLHRLPHQLTCKENFLDQGMGLRPRKPLGLGTTEELNYDSSVMDFTDETVALPRLTWVNSSDLWRKMRGKDSTKAAPDTELRVRHPGIMPNMRTILLDWMMEASPGCKEGGGGGWGEQGSRECIYLNRISMCFGPFATSDMCTLPLAGVIKYLNNTPTQTQQSCVAHP